MKHFYFLLLLSGFLVTSCNNVDSMTLSKAESRLIGTWTITKAQNKVKGDGKWGKNDVSNNYLDWEFTFEANYDASLYVPEEEKTFVGYWELYETLETDSDGDQSLVTNLYIYVYNPDNFDEYREFYWEDMSISNTKFDAQEMRTISGNDHRYYYQLSK